MDSLNDLRTQNRDLRVKLQNALARNAELEAAAGKGHQAEPRSEGRMVTPQKKLDEPKKHG